MESHITFSSNKTDEWLENQVNTNEIIEQRRKEVKNEKTEI